MRKMKQKKSPQMTLKRLSNNQKWKEERRQSESVKRDRNAEDDTDDID